MGGGHRFKSIVSPAVTSFQPGSLDNLLSLWCQFLMDDVEVLVIEAKLGGWLGCFVEDRGLGVLRLRRLASPK